ncbi:MAG: alpha/beta fold hydrolase [Sandaracinaceae bacterium]|nr:alpha/beta fold hydrolase [Sandaracinaceae bacterium]
MSREWFSFWIVIGSIACGPEFAPPDGGVRDASGDGFVADASDGAIPDAPLRERPTALFVLDGAADFFDLPWPNDARLSPMGTPDLRAFPTGGRSLVQRYIDAIGQAQQGWSTNGAVYFRFSHPIDPSTLPQTLEDSVAPHSSVWLIRIDGDPTRHPFVTYFEPRKTRFWPGNVLAVRPPDGLPLERRSRYAVVITNRLKAIGGQVFERDRDFSLMLSGDPRFERTARLYAPALAAAERLGLQREQVVAMTVFETQDPIAIAERCARFIREEIPPPEVDNSAWSLRESTRNYSVVHGRYFGSPRFQAGSPPYRSEGGAIQLSPSGDPIVHEMEEIRFALAIPRSPMPPGGYPIALYAHGTGGDHRSFIEDETAALLAERGIATMGIDAPFHGNRPSGSDPSLDFFNVLNPHAVRWNPVQTALEHIVQARIASTLEIPRSILERDGQPIRFDRERVYFIGHSQGALVGPIYLVLDPLPKAALFSAGGSLIGHSFIAKTLPIDIPRLVQGLLGLSGANPQEAFEMEGFVMEHPLITLVQGWIDVSDPGNYARFAFESPLPGRPHRSVILIEGMRDQHVPPPSAEALATAFRAPPAEPIVRPLPGLRFLGIPEARGTVEANARGGATAALLQFAEGDHFVFFYDARGRARVSAFFASLLDGGPGRLPSP